jgi:hypothetical protein
MKLPNAEKAFVDIEKLRGYCLNQFHERGKHKARLFSSILGFTQENAEKLRDLLLQSAHTDEARITKTDICGIRYVIELKATTQKGYAKIRSTWIKHTHEDFVRLTSCYILK